MERAQPPRQLTTDEIAMLDALLRRAEEAARPLPATIGMRFADARKVLRRCAQGARED